VHNEEEKGSKGVQPKSYPRPGKETQKNWCQIDGMFYIERQQNFLVSSIGRAYEEACRNIWSKEKVGEGIAEIFKSMKRETKV